MEVPLSMAAVVRNFDVERHIYVFLRRVLRCYSQ